MITEEKNIQRIKKLDGFSNDLHLSSLYEGQSVYMDLWGKSMYPFMKNGDRIKIVPLNKSRIKIGDIVSVNRRKQGGQWFLLHRVVKITGRGEKRIYFTKGDASKSVLDEPVVKEMIVGKITQIQRKDLEINLEHPFWRFFNSIIARLSLRCPEILCFLSRYVGLMIEWRSFLFKTKIRLGEKKPAIYNTEELLLICARGDLSEELRRKAQDLINEGLSWTNFTKSAIEGGIIILVYNSLKIIVLHVRIPQFVFDRLKNAYLLIISKAAFQHKEQLELLKLFSKNNIPVMPLKGTFLSMRLYGDVATRGLSADIDLLIEERSKETAQILLQEFAYSLRPSNEIKQWQWQYDFSKSQSMVLDLHWDITMVGRSKERIEGLWKGTRRVAEDGISYYEFEEEELLLYLATHFVNSSRFRRLRYICDVNELLHKYKDKLNWNAIIDKAKKWRLANSLYVTLSLCKKLLNSDVPGYVLERLRPSFLTRILIKTFVSKRVILRSNLRRRIMDHFLSYIFFELIEVCSIKEYFSILKRVFLPPKEIIGSRSPILRIFKGLRKFVRNIFI